MDKVDEHFKAQVRVIQERLQKQDRRIFSLSVQQEQLKDMIIKPLSKRDRSKALARSKTLEKLAFEQVGCIKKIEENIQEIREQVKDDSVPKRIRFFDLKRRLSKPLITELKQKEESPVPSVPEPQKRSRPLSSRSILTVTSESKSISTQLELKSPIPKLEHPFSAVGMFNQVKDALIERR